MAWSTQEAEGLCGGGGCFYLLKIQPEPSPKHLANIWTACRGKKHTEDALRTQESLHPVCLDRAAILSATHAFSII